MESGCYGQGEAIEGMMPPCASPGLLLEKYFEVFNTSTVACEDIHL